MQNNVNSLASLLALLEIDNIAFDKPMPRPGIFSDKTPYLIKIRLMAGRKIIQTDN